MHRQVDLAVALGVIAGLPLGAKFISDAIIADIIDYDEFLSGQRNEATYTMFQVGEGGHWFTVTLGAGVTVWVRVRVTVVAGLG